MKSIKINDKINTKDGIKPNIWAKTQIIGGYDYYKDDKGISQLGEVVFEETNIVPIGGVQFVFEQVFGIGKSSFEIPTLHNTPIDIGDVEDGTLSNITLDTNDIDVEQGIPLPHNWNEKVCLFGVGCNGTASNNITIVSPEYKDYMLDGMVPFRFIDSNNNNGLTVAEQDIYFGKVTNKLAAGKTAYFLKKFDNIEFYHRLNDSDEYSDGTELKTNGSSSINPFSPDYSNTSTIESYVEAKLIINKADIKEWFDYNGNIEETRINSIGLFSAYRPLDASSDTDYANVRLFSKFNMASEPLGLTKELTILYRVYGS